MTRLIWTHSLSTCSGAWAWSALVKQTQITACWVRTQPGETADLYLLASASAVQLHRICLFFLILPPRLPLYHIHSDSLSCMHFPRTTTTEYLILSLLSWATVPAWWFSMASCRVCSGSKMAAATQHTQCLHRAVRVQQLDRECDGSGFRPLCQLTPLVWRLHEAADR